MKSPLKESLARMGRCSPVGTRRAREMLLPTAVSKEEPRRLERARLNEKEGKIRRSSASPRSCSSFVSSLGLASHLMPGMGI